MSIDYYGWSVDIDDSTNLTENDIHSLLKYKSFDDMFSFCQGYITPDDYVFTDVLFPIASSSEITLVTARLIPDVARVIPNK